ncbi:ImmA/IrrE family metallo-endopeptidase [Anaeromyxobacter sp. PSR-1]|uniref:ImmA/IrrE family metallo-endopeptidase n=1 Tax=Anaeromyxobacter sp. PSR-1 TaxID=1300915 RepID=UPI0005EA6368|nr:ImmA/IrrE family metallo-endopeptidase [Anaeromyxobacter sp. PSR-1]GAO02089.1 hypothetical protein PSR1_00960 [Anaeromyxobacter sp. PSR-1]
MTTRDARLGGIKEAQRLHRALGTKARFAEGATRIDVFSAAVSLNVTLMFRPLKGLLGAFLNEPAPGILVSTQRPLHVQRFTAAHELGHFRLQHKPSLDEEVGGWRGGHVSAQEAAADAFASEFLLPKWILAQHAARQGWHSAALRDPRHVYQLALRTGASYEAACWALAAHGALTAAVAASLTSVPLKELKSSELHGVPMADPWADVWAVSERDHNLLVEGGPNDLFVFRLVEHSGGGYLWDKAQLADIGLEILADERMPSNDNEIGAPIGRVIVARAATPGGYRVHIDERRPWLEATPNSQLAFELELNGKEFGLPRSYRKTLLSSTT